MIQLRDMENIGPELEKRLLAAGISSGEDLMHFGSREAFIRLRQGDSSACLSMLNALEGAIQGQRWHFLPQAIKAELKAYYNKLEPRD